MRDFHFLHNPAATLGLYQVPDPSRCGVAITDSSGVIVDFEEKPQNPRSHWAFSGVMIAGPQFLQSIPSIIPADIGFHVLPSLAGKMQAYPIHEYLLDIGTMPNYEKAQMTWPVNHAAPPLPRSANQDPRISPEENA
jgi:glucose-1-phosphate adenylyltransferase